MGEVVGFEGQTVLDIPVERVCDAAKGLAHVLVLGQEPDGEFYFASDTGDLAWAALMLVRAQRSVAEMFDDAGPSGQSDAG